MNLIGRLQSERKNNFFLITNRLEHVNFLNSTAPKINANTILFDRSAQFSIKCGLGDMDEIMDSKMPGLGASNNFMDSSGYRKARSKIFIVASNNSLDDKIFLRHLADPERKFLTFSPADTNSLYVENFVPIFGNNSCLKS